MSGRQEQRRTEAGFPARRRKRVSWLGLSPSFEFDEEGRSDRRIRVTSFNCFPLLDHGGVVVLTLRVFSTALLAERRLCVGVISLARGSMSRVR